MWKLRWTVVDRVNELSSLFYIPGLFTCPPFSSPPSSHADNSLAGTPWNVGTLKFWTFTHRSQYMFPSSDFNYPACGAEFWETSMLVRMESSFLSLSSHTILKIRIRVHSLIAQLGFFSTSTSSLGCDHCRTKASNPESQRPG